MGLISCLVMGRILGFNFRYLLYTFRVLGIVHSFFFSMYFFILNGVGIVDFFPLAFHLHSINVSLDRLNALIQISYGNLHYVSGFFSSSLFYYMSGVLVLVNGRWLLFFSGNLCF
jgi:hypothetical protein